MVLGQARIDPNPESAVHHDVGIGDRADHAVIAAFHVGLAEQVAGKQQPGADLAVVIEELDKLFAVEWGLQTQGGGDRPPLGGPG
jgi:hypothetical protein